MTTIKDPLATFRPEGRDRLNYRLGIALDAEDFVAEQLYHRDRLARALKYLFGTGTVVGLRVWRDADEIKVEPGIALDALGRLVEVPRQACLDLRRWFDEHEEPAALQTSLDNSPGGDRVVADVFLEFVVCPRGKTPAFALGPFEATNAVADHRLRDGYRLSFVVRSEASPIPAPYAAITPNDVRTDADPLRRLEDLMLDGWRDGTEDWNTAGDEPVRFPEVPAQVDATAVLIARVTIPAGVGADGRVHATADLAPTAVDNHIRRFVYAPGALVQLSPPTP